MNSGHTSLTLFCLMKTQAHGSNAQDVNPSWEVIASNGPSLSSGRSRDHTQLWDVSALTLGWASECLAHRPEVEWRCCVLLVSWKERRHDVSWHQLPFARPHALQHHCLSLSSFCAPPWASASALRRFCWSAGDDCTVCISTCGCGCCRCCFCCCSMACRRCCCSVACRCCGSFGGVGVDFSIVGDSVQSNIVVLVVVQVFCLESRSHQSFSAGDTMRTCSFAHLIAVAPCETHRLLPSPPMTLASHISPVIQGISKNVVTSYWSEPSNQALSDLRVRFHLNCCHPTLVSVLGLFPEPARRRQEWQICLISKNVAKNTK